MEELFKEESKVLSFKHKVIRLLMDNETTKYYIEEYLYYRKELNEVISEELSKKRISLFSSNSEIIEYFISYFKEKCDDYPKWIDNLLSTYGNVFIWAGTYKRSINKLQQKYKFKEIRYLPANEKDIKPGYILTVDSQK